ncbi:MAG: hypothetical protein KF895_16730, partial [Parvibaculum sp.]|nr:hypothetical protein [Parvibaculum sp.]MBX3548703.1 hypothetical protein [Xanthobacteraceae bacterium]
IYATGAVLYRALAGQPPANAEDRMQKLAFGKPDPIKPLAMFAPGLPHEIAAAIDRALSFNAESRQPKIGELRAALGWGEGEGSVPTIALPRDADARRMPLRAQKEKRSKLPWLLPLAGIAVVLMAALILSGVITLPVGKEIVETPPPAPKFDEMKVVPQMQVHTPPEAETPKEQTKQEEIEPRSQQAEPRSEQQALVPPAMVCPPGQQELDGKCVSPAAAYPKWFTGEITLVRAEPVNPSLPLTACVPGRRVPLIILVEGGKLRISQGGNTYFVDFNADGTFDYSGGIDDTGANGRPLLNKIKVKGRITAQKIEASYANTVERGSCFGTFTAVAAVSAQPQFPPAPR